MWVEFGKRARMWACAMCLFFVGASGGVTGLAQMANTAAPKQSLSEKIAASKDLLDINTATAAQLSALPGMGAAYAARVIAGRPYTAKNQLTMRGILPVVAYVQIKPLIIAHRVKK